MTVSSSPNSHGLPPDFATRIQERLRLADLERQRRAAAERRRHLGYVAGPFIFAACCAALPWTFLMGARALIAVVSFVTLLLAVGQRGDQVFLSYLGVSVAPAIIDALLLLGVVSWLAWASHSPARPAEQQGNMRE